MSQSHPDRGHVIWILPTSSPHPGEPPIRPAAGNSGGLHVCPGRGGSSDPSSPSQPGPAREGGGGGQTSASSISTSNNGLASAMIGNLVQSSFPNFLFLKPEVKDFKKKREREKEIKRGLQKLTLMQFWSSRAAAATCSRVQLFWFSAAKSQR